MVTFSALKEGVESLRRDLGDYRTSAAIRERDVWARVANARIVNDDLSEAVEKLETELRRAKESFETALHTELVSLKAEFIILKRDVEQLYERADASLEDVLREQKDLKHRVMSVETDIASYTQNQSILDARAGRSVNPSVVVEVPHDDAVVQRDTNHVVTPRFTSVPFEDSHSPVELSHISPMWTNAERLDRILKLKQGQLVDGETWYLVSKSWMSIWEALCRVTPRHATVFSLTNEAIADEDGRLMSNLQVGEQLEFIAKDAWDLLVEWYGQPRHVFVREVTPVQMQGNPSYVLHLDPYPLHLKVFYWNKRAIGTHTPVLRIARQATISTLKSVIERFNLPERYLTIRKLASDAVADSRVWCRRGCGSGLLYTLTCEEAFQQGDTVLVWLAKKAQQGMPQSLGKIAFTSPIPPPKEFFYGMSPV